MYNTAFGIIIILVFVSLVVLFCALLLKYFIHRERKFAQQLYQKDIDFQKELNASIIETQEQLFNSISQELHDDAGQQLTVINFQIENLKLGLPQQVSSLDLVSESISNLSNSIRNISHSMNNQILSQQNLFQALKSEIDRLKKNSRLKIEDSLEFRLDKVFTESEKIIIYRIFQEIINNIFKHAKATQVHIVIKSYPYFEMSITDNGTGFDKTTFENEKVTLGLQNIKNRADIITYDLAIASSVEQGTTIILSEKEQL